ncbi:hypothetical protein [Streptomyces sp. NPDC018031]
MSLTVYTIEMAYARMRELQELASRSRAHQSASPRRAPAAQRRTAAKKR